MKHISFPSIEQFRNVVRNVNHRAHYVGTDVENNPIYDVNVKNPTLKFEGTCKLHGTNAGVVLSLSDPSNPEVWMQSRENIITPEKDNAGFAAWVLSKNEAIYDLLYCAVDVCGIPNPTIAIWGEWCGKGIQKGVAISELPKMFVVFAVALVHDNQHKTWFTKDEIAEIFVKSMYNFNECNIYHIWQFPTFEIEIDFERPDMSQNMLGAHTISVETTCPVGAHFGVMGVGEGIVWRCVTPEWDDSGYWFKVKGDKHSNTKVKKLAEVDVEKVNSIKECVEKICTENRMEQMFQKFYDGQPIHYLGPDMKDLGIFLKALNQDCIKEELDTITISGLEPKDIGKEISNVGRKWFINRLG